MATLNDMNKIFNVLLIAFPYYEKDKTPIQIADAITLYHRLLADIDTRLLETAVEHYISSADSKYFPAISDLRRLALHLVTFNQAGAEDAWLEVKKAIKHTGYYGVPVFEDKRISHAVEVMGWRNLCMSENEVADRAHFFRIFESVEKRDTEVNIMTPSTRDKVTALIGQTAKRLSGGHQ